MTESDQSVTMTLAPHYRGYANLGVGAYVINHSKKGAPPELIISIASEEEKRGRVVGDTRDNPPDAVLRTEDMAVRLRFTSVAGYHALMGQLHDLYEEHFAEIEEPDSVEFLLRQRLTDVRLYLLREADRHTPRDPILSKAYEMTQAPLNSRPDNAEELRQWLSDEATAALKRLQP